MTERELKEMARGAEDLARQANLGDFKDMAKVLGKELIAFKRKGKPTLYEIPMDGGVVIKIYPPGTKEPDRWVAFAVSLPTAEEPAS